MARSVGSCFKHLEMKSINAVNGEGEDEDTTSTPTGSENTDEEEEEEAEEEGSEKMLSLSIHSVSTIGGMGEVVLGLLELLG